MSKTTVSILQEISVRRKFIVKYEVVAESGDPHNKVFEVKVSVDGSSVFGLGAANKKNDAKKLAAREALNEFLAHASFALSEQERCEIRNIIGCQEVENDADISVGVGNSIGSLEDVTTRLKLPAPEFNCVLREGPPHRPEFTMDCKVGELTTTGKSTQKKTAKKIAAAEMLKLLGEPFNSSPETSVNLVIDPPSGFDSDAPDDSKHYSSFMSEVGDLSYTVFQPVHSVVCPSSENVVSSSTKPVHSTPLKKKTEILEYPDTSADIGRNEEPPAKKSTSTASPQTNSSHGSEANLQLLKEQFDLFMLSQLGDSR